MAYETSKASEIKGELVESYDIFGYKIHESHVDGKACYNVMSKDSPDEVVTQATRFGDVLKYCRSH